MIGQRARANKATWRLVLSHNGTAKSVGLDMMTSSDLVAMATLDYSVISSTWKSIMPNRMIVKQLLEKTKASRGSRKQIPSQRM